MTTPSAALPHRAPPEHFRDETVIGKAFDRRLMARLLRYGRPYRLGMAVTILAILLTTALGIVGPFIVSHAIDGPLRSSIADLRSSGTIDRAALQELLLLSGLFVGVSIALIGLRFLENYNMAKIGQQVMLDLRLELFSHLQRMPFAFYDRNPVGRLVTRITNDIEALNELFSSGIVTFIADVMVLTGITVALLWRNVQLALVMLAVLPFILLVTLIFRRKAREYYREQRGHLAHLNAFTQESLQGMGIIQLFHRQESNFRHYQGINAAYLDAFQRSVFAYSLYFPAVEVLGKLALIAIIWNGANQFYAGELTFGDLYFFWYYLERFFQPIRDMAERYNVLQAAMASAERVFKVLDTPESLPELKSQALARRSLPGKVEFKNVWFAYDGKEFVLKDVSFAVQPGETVAIVGATGAGKSTIINLMSRFYDPQRGTIEVDGVDVRSYDKRALRARIGIVLQDVFLFSRSIRDNIRLGNGDIPDARLAECTHLVNADRFIAKVPDGWEQKLGERGASLSVGEKQLLAFARALAHEPDFLVLDEATASVDTETEQLIQDALRKLLAGRTSIVIAHRLSTIRRSDKILVLHKGEIRERGTHAELLRLKGIYYRLHQLQYQ